MKYFFKPVFSLIVKSIFIPALSIAQDPPIVRPPAELIRAIKKGDNLGAVQLNVIPGARVKKNLTTGLVAWIQDLPAPPGATTQREAAEQTIEAYKTLLGVNTDLSNIVFLRETVPMQGNPTTGFIWRQVYNGVPLFGPGMLTITVRDNLEIVKVSSSLRPISSNTPISFPSDPSPAINEAIQILNATHIPNAQALGQAEQRVYLNNGQPQAAWYITFAPESKIHWWILLDATTNEALLADFTGSHRPPSQ